MKDYLFKRIKLCVDYLLKRIMAVGAQVCLKAFIRMYERPWTGIQFVVHEESKRVAKMMTDKWLTANRIIHCARCLSMQEMHRTLVEVDGRAVYLCKKCFESGTACGAVKPKLEIVKP